MSVVLAVLENSASVGPVLDAAARLAEFVGSDVEAVYVPGSATLLKRARPFASRAGIALRPLPGPGGEDLVAAVADPEVVAAVISARSNRAGRHPVRPVARNLIEHTRKPVVVLRPGVVVRPVLRRLLVPLEGTELSTQPVLDHLSSLLPEAAELVVLHVFTPDTLPSMLDRPARDLEILGREFLHHHLPHARRIELRHGSVANTVAEVSAQQESDLVVLSWSQDSSPGRAEVIREVLSSCPVPVLLLPAPALRQRGQGGGRDEATG